MAAKSSLLAPGGSWPGLRTAPSRKLGATYLFEVAAFASVIFNISFKIPPYPIILFFNYSSANFFN